MGPAMKVRFERGIDDILAFNLYQRDHSRSVRRSSAQARWLVPAILAGAAVLIGILTADVVTPMCVAIVLFVYIAVFPVWTRYASEKIVRRLYAEGSVERAFGTCELELADEGIIERTVFSQRYTAWPGIERVVSTEDHTFIYLNAAEAHILPWRAVTEGNYEAFVSALNARLQLTGAALAGWRQAAWHPAQVGEGAPLADREQLPSTATEYAPPFHKPTKAPKRHSGVGIASFVMGLIAGVTDLVLVVVAAVLGAIAPPDVDAHPPESDLLAAGLVCACLLNFIGLVLGIAALFQKDRKREFAILGLCVNSLIVLGIIALGLSAHAHTT